MDAIVAAASAYEAGLNRYLETEKTRDDTLKTVVEAAAALQSSGETLAKLESEAMAWKPFSTGCAPARFR